MNEDQLTFLLIHPEISRTRYNFVGIIENECLELEYIASMLKDKGHTVYLYDGQVEHVGVPKALRRYKPDVVYVCGRTRQENFMLEYCRDAKAFNRKTLTILGGLHAQLSYERLYKNYVDYILTTFDIYKILDIVDYAVYKKPMDRAGLDGICYKGKRGWVSNPAKPFDINALPLPDRSYYDAHPNNYRYLELEHAAWVRTAYSCPYHCQFCHRNRMNCGVYSCRDMENVVEEIASIPSKNIYIVDDDFLFDEKRISQFIQLVKERKIHKQYICYGRSDFIATHPSIMRQMREIGLYYVLVGLEDIKDTRLAAYNKKSKVEYNVRSIHICKRLGIHLMGMFILDLDYSTKDFRALYKWIQKYNLRHVAISIFTPEFGMETYEACKERLITSNPSHWDYLHVVARPTKLSVQRYYMEYYRLLIKLFLRAQRQGVYDFIDYKTYLLSFLGNILRTKRSQDDE